MRIGFDARMTDWSGIGTYSVRVIDELVKLTKDELILFTNPQSNGYKGPHEGVATVIEVNLPVFSLFQQRWEAVLTAADLDAFFTPYILVPYKIPCVSVGTIHDLIPWRIPSVMKRKSGRIFYRNWIMRAVRNYQNILVDSDFTRDDVLDFLKVPEATVKTVPAAASEVFKPIGEEGALDHIAAKYGIKKPFFLNVGTARLHKNLESLIFAFKSLVIDGVKAKLVFAGPEGNLRSKHKRLVNDLGLSDVVLFTGKVAQDDLPAIYNSAMACIFPSIIEGFGLPALESMACGTPVICGDGSSLAEVVGEAGLLIGPRDIAGLAAAMAKVAADSSLREEMSKKGLERAKLYSWEKTAAAILEAIYEVAEEE